MLLCLHCRKEWEYDPELDCCPGCADEGVPANLENTVEVRITWHELRVLTIWAERFASSVRDEEQLKKMLKVVYTIADRLQAQHLDQRAGLTFASELAELRGRPGVTEVKQNVIKELKP